MRVERDKRDLAKLLRTLRSMDRIEVAQFMAQVVDEMVSEQMPESIIRDTCSEICRSIGVSSDDMHRGLH